MSKRTLLLLSDHIATPSGVGKMARSIVKHTVSEYNWVCVGGNLGVKLPFRPEDMSDVISKETEVDDASVLVYPHARYGNQNIVRYLLNIHNIDGILHFTDPHNFDWLYRMEHEVRQEIPIMYYHVWDNLPVPEYNSAYYNSCDWIGTISKLTQKIVSDLHENDHDYIPHGVNSRVYYPIKKGMARSRTIGDQTINDYDVIQQLKKQWFGDQQKFVVFWNNRNLRRKRGADVINSFAKFASMINDKSACTLIMKTNPIDKEGFNLYEVNKAFADNLDVRFVTDFVEEWELNLYYNIADVTINIADREGFGLTTAESIMAGTPIVCSVTGGLQDQCGFKNKNASYAGVNDDLYVKHGTNSMGDYQEHGEWCVPIFPRTRSIIGTQNQPYLYQDWVDVNDVAKGLLHFYNMTSENRTKVGIKGRSYLMDTKISMREEDMGNRFLHSINNVLDTFEPRKRFELIKC